MERSLSASIPPLSSPKIPASPPLFPRRSPSGSALNNLAAPQPAATAWDPSEPDPKHLLRMAGGVCNARSGSVLARGMILKSEFRPPRSETLMSQDETVVLQGATNFRLADLGVYGVAQPTETGLRTILSVLRSQRKKVGEIDDKGKGRETVWFCTREEPVVYIGARPFVLRDANEPTRTYALSDRAENIEAIESRLKADILREAARYGGVILVQEEISTDQILNTWVAVDAVRTVRELWEEVAKDYNLVYHRIPVTRDQSPEDRYLDVYTTILAAVPTTSSLVFNCGLGQVRTTFAMSAALIVRRKQLMQEGREDPYGIEMEDNPATSPRLPIVGVAKVMRSRSEQAIRDRSLLRLTSVLQKSLPEQSQQSILTLLSSQPQLLENLRSALLGQYDLILSLLSCLDDGAGQKMIVDAIVDQCDALVNVRESILQHRVRHASLALAGEHSRLDHRSKALAALDRYFFLITFASFVQESDNGFTVKFSAWINSRSEISKMSSRMRKSGQVFVFSPVHDLSAISRGGAATVASGTSRSRLVDLQRSGGQVIGDEFAEQIVQDRSGIILRAGTILKSDHWTAAGAGDKSTIRGAINFRRVPSTSLYGLSQPTQDGIERVLEEVRKGMEKGARVVWINLREEPLLYINGTPYVLRSQAVSLRNLKSYAGISSSRLELLEDRLKSDILAEVALFDGRILLHTETNGLVTPVWETIESVESIKTLREVMDALPNTSDFTYLRIPITAERAPDFSDVREIVEQVAQLEQSASIIVNCQLGRGRSTRALVLITLVQRWLRQSSLRLPPSVSEIPSSTRNSFSVINNLLRTIRAGQEVKNWVDEAIGLCGSVYDLLDAIEESRQTAEDNKDNPALVQKGLQNLRCYFFIILFAHSLSEQKAQTWREFKYEAFVRDRPVFKTIERELEHAGLSSLVPLQRSVESSNALSDEVHAFVARRSGRILSAMTLLKSDYFSGLQKMSLPERVHGVPNFRRAPLLFSSTEETNGTMTGSMVGDGVPLIYGTGMPTIAGLRRGLERMGARTKRIIWTSMREEPVIYVSGGRPHVLRLFDSPLENVVTTGVTASTVEAMELALKRDLLNESAQNGGKILLHDEIEETDGSFTITATWEAVTAADILTPQEVFAAMREEGLQVDYERLPVTDEQSPIPATYSRIEERVTDALCNTTGEFAIIFNCQMGRGRTTTGMVAAALVANILFNGAVVDELTLADDVASDSAARKLSWDGRETDPYLDGEYKIVLQLVGVLQHGKLAKKLTDRAIDTMEGVQNLRKAVYDFKLRAEAADAGSKKQAKILSVALSYLYRYATLIVFSDYLLEKAAATEQPDPVLEFSPFPSWCLERREISHILSRRTLE